MKASETRLQLILEGTKQYVVPMFQRTYSWDKRDWTTLWSDLMDLLEEENPRPHFIGSIVTSPANYCLRATGVAGLTGEDWTVELA